MRGSNALTLDPGRLRQRAAVGIKAATEGSIRGLARAVEFVVVFASWLLLPVWPVLAAVILRDAEYLRRYRATLARMKRHLLAIWHTRPVSRMMARRLTPPLRRAPEGIVGNCTHCGRCCLDGACVFLDFDDQGRSNCRIYGQRLWKMLFANCARYPIDGQEIAQYGCPGYTAVPGLQAGPRRVIPIVPAMQPAALESFGAESSETTVEGLGT